MALSAGARFGCFVEVVVVYGCFKILIVVDQREGVSKEMVLKASQIALVVDSCLQRASV